MSEAHVGTKKAKHRRTRESKNEDKK